ncbi:hypothetical protein [Liquorilactobacillus satsumensis]|nr:hypothetical protein [Liquorilactobacillus satsumensis]
MDELDVLLIKEYMNIPAKIKRLRCHKKRIEYRFNHQPFISSCMGYNEDGTRAKLLPIDKEVINYISHLEYIDWAINVLKFKYKNFVPILKKIRCEDVLLLKHGKKCSRIASKKILEEIAEIEEATSWKYNLEPEPASHASENVNENLKNILDLIS